MVTRLMHRLPGIVLMAAGGGLIILAVAILSDPGAGDALPLPTLTLPPTPTPGILAGWDISPPPLENTPGLLCNPPTNSCGDCQSWPASSSQSGSSGSTGILIHVSLSVPFSRT